MSKKTTAWLLVLSSILILVLAACQSAAPTVEPADLHEAVEVQASEPDPAFLPAVVVSDQEISDSRVTVAAVVSEKPGWLVIHAQAEGAPGPILGVTPLVEGENRDVMVEIDAANLTETLYAMLHTDAGEAGTFEFPGGPDIPVTVDGVMVSPAFMVTSVQASPVEEVVAPQAPEATGMMVLRRESDDLGAFLVDADGMTLYIFARDEPGTSNCYDQCAVNWPPLLLGDGVTPSAGDGLPAELGTILRNDGGTQLAYNGWPLYYWVNDAAPGDTSGHGVGGVWAVAGLEPVVLTIIPGESQVSYEVGETFFNENNRFNTAIGITTQVEGSILGDLANPKSVVVGPVTIDISQFTSDSSRRDNKIREDFLESLRYPLATFLPTQIESLPGTYTPGDQLSLRISGDLTVKEVTRPATFDVTVRFDGATMTGEATTTILMSDFGIGPISILGMLETEDQVKLGFTFVARHAQAGSSAAVPASLGEDPEEDLDEGFQDDYEALYP